MYLIIESSAFSEKGARREKTNCALFALTHCSHATLLSIDAQIIHWPWLYESDSSFRMDYGKSGVRPIPIKPDNRAREVLGNASSVQRATPDHVFDTGNPLAERSAWLVMWITAVMMVVGSIERILSPQPIQYKEAIVVAIRGAENILHER